MNNTLIGCRHCHRKYLNHVLRYVTHKLQLKILRSTIGPDKKWSVKGGIERDRGRKEIMSPTKRGEEADTMERFVNSIPLSGMYYLPKNLLRILFYLHRLWQTIKYELILSTTSDTNKVIGLFSTQNLGEIFGLQFEFVLQNY